MSTIQNAVGRTRRRMWLSGLLSSAVWTLTGVLAAAVLVRVAERVFALEIDWALVAMVMGGVWVVGSVVGSLLVAPNRMAAARRLDECAGLGERVSSAMSVGEADDAWSRAVVGDATDRLSGPKGRAAVASVPVEWPRAWAAPVIALCAGMIVWATVPELDLSGEVAKREEEAQKAAELKEVATVIEAEQEQLNQKLAEAGLGDELKPEQAGDLEAEDPEELKRERIKQLTSLSERIEQQRNGEKGEQVKAIQDAMKKLKRPGPGPMDELARSLAKGDLTGAKKQLEDLRQKLESGELSDEQRDALSKQMENMSQQLEAAANEQKQSQRRLEDQLAEAGVNPEQAEKLSKMAANPESLKKALEAMQNLTPEQREQLMKQAQGSKAAQEMLQKMSQQMQAASEFKNPGQGGESSQAMGEMGEMLSQAEMAAMEAAAMEAAGQMAMSQLQSMSNMMTAEQWAECFGQGAGMPSGQPGPSGPTGGQGTGAGPAEEAGMFGTNRSKAKVVTKEGPYIGSRYVYESQVIGESRAALAEAVASSGAVASEALDNNAVPVEYHESVKRYFGRLAERVEAEKAAETPAEAAPVDEPSE